MESEVDVAKRSGHRARWLGSAVLGPSKTLMAIAIGAIGAASVMVITPKETWVAGAILSFALAWAAMVDIDRLILPNVITLPLIGLGLALAVDQGWSAAFDHCIGAAVGFVVLTSVASTYRHFRRKEGLGRGDAKLFAAAGAWLGWIALPAVMLTAALGAVGYVAGRAAIGRITSNDTAIPFGPFLAIGCWLVWIAIVLANHTNS